MFLGEIVIDTNLEDNQLIKQLRDKKFIKITNTINKSNIPKLFVGWGKVQKQFPDEIKITSKKIKKNNFWTFSPEENTQDFNEDTIKFIDRLYDDFITTISYIFIDPIIHEINKSSEIFNFLQSDIFDTAYITDDFIYLYQDLTKTIIGLDLKLLSFFKFNIKIIKELIEKNTTKVLVEDYTLDNSIYQKYKNYLNKDFDKKYISYLEYVFQE